MIELILIQQLLEISIGANLRGKVNNLDSIPAKLEVKRARRRQKLSKLFMALFSYEKTLKAIS